jgi:hypothetical protein
MEKYERKSCCRRPDPEAEKRQQTKPAAEIPRQPGSGGRRLRKRGNSGCRKNPGQREFGQQANLWIDSRNPNNKKSGHAKKPGTERIQRY